jgi:hypothetical protein
MPEIHIKHNMSGGAVMIFGSMSIVGVNLKRECEKERC